MTLSNGSEKRRHSRVDFKTGIRLILNAGGKTIAVDAGSKDLSLKGVFVTTRDTFDVGTRCEIDILLTGSVDEIALNIQGIVARKNEAGMGISFHSMGLEAYAHLKNIIRYNTDNGDGE